MRQRLLALAALFGAAFATPASAQQAGQNTWVAVADDGRDAVGYAVGMGTREAAEVTALDQCGNSCSIKMTAMAPCVAYARSDPGDASGYAAGIDLEAVRQTAWSDCNRRVLGNTCRVRVAQCFQ
jgi:hypothetical protein